ncbi:hypothetical protein HPP92_001263 [Vanilla planifolia]|nr:hypothetical protein HPP92_001263 [Vanilla planifolia]
MKEIPLLPFLLFLIFPTTLTASTGDDGRSSTFTPRDYILLDCGATGQHTDLDNRTWVGDTGSKYAPSLKSAGSSAQSQDSSIPQYPYLTARVFTTPFSYKFPLTPGRKYLRLYFYPTSYSNHAATNSFFSVGAGPITLLRNFSAYQTALALNFAYLVREFSIQVTSTTLYLNFTPSTNHTSSFAFINGIEIVSMPDIFSFITPRFVTGRTIPIQYPINKDWAMQTVYRLNVGGQTIPPSSDSGLFRLWEDDSPYIYGAAFGVSYSADPNVTIEYSNTLLEYIAPKDVYASARSMGPNPNVNLNYNLSWILPVDAGFYYLVRLHFCEIQYPITKVNQRVFAIYINNQTAQEEADVIIWSGGIGKPVIEDYVVFTLGSGLVDMWLALHPDTETRPEYFDAILNGVEVFKLQDAADNLAGPNPNLPPQPDARIDMMLVKENVSKANWTPSIAGTAAFLALFCLVVVLYKRQKRRGKPDCFKQFSETPEESNSGFVSGPTSDGEGTPLRLAGKYSDGVVFFQVMSPKAR